MSGPYRAPQVDGRKLEPDPTPRRRVHLAGITTTLLGVGIGATAPMLGPLVAVLGGGMALLGIALFHEAPQSSMKATCPSCGEEIGEIDPSADAVHCSTCGDYARLGSGMLFPMSDDFVASRPTFAIPVSRTDATHLPAICAECGSRSVSRRVPVEVHVPGIPLASESSYRVVGVPHCAQHASGAAPDLSAVRVRSRALWVEAAGRT
jgi:hypothetical protein